MLFLFLIQNIIILVLIFLKITILLKSAKIDYLLSWDFISYYLVRKEGNWVKISLKAARVNAGLSQDALAKEIGVSKSTVSRWEIGRIAIPDDELQKICNICKINKKDIILQERKEE